MSNKMIESEAVSSNFYNYLYNQQNTRRKQLYITIYHDEIFGGERNVAEFVVVFFPVNCHQRCRNHAR